MYILYFIFSFVLLAEDKIETNEINSIQQLNIVEMLNGPNNVGKDFWITVPPPYLVGSPTNYTRFFVASKYDGNVSINQKGGISRAMQIKSGVVKSFDLKPDECQPFIHTLNDNYGLPTQVLKDKALNITSDVPIVVYVMIRYQYTSDGFMALPVSGLGKEYVATNYDAREWNPGSLPNFLTIVAPYDDTKVEFTLGGNEIAQVQIKGGKILKPGDKTLFTMNKGDVIVISNLESDETLSGSLITANKDIGVISANYCADVPLRVRACDYIVEMEMPMNTWGKVYALPLMENRDKPSIIRVFAKEDSTSVYRDSQELIHFSKGVGQTGGKQNEAWFETRIWPVGLELKPAIYTSNKPIYIMLFNPSSQDDNKPTDPFQMLIPPIEQFQKEIIFNTPSAPDGINFGANFASIVIEVDENGLVPEDMLFGTIGSNGEINWVSFRTRFGSYSKLMHEIGSGIDSTFLKESKLKGKIFGYKWVQLPSEGTYVIKSSKLVSVFLSGVDNYDSYGFPAGTSLKVLNSGDTISPKIEWSIDCNGKVNGKTTELTADINSVGLYFPYSLPDEEINFSPLVLNEEFVKGSKSIIWSAKVKDKSEDASLIVTFYDLAGNFKKDTVIFNPKDYFLDEPIIKTVGDTLLCDSNESVSFIVLDGNYSRLEWSNGITSQTMTTNKSGKYYATIYDEEGCSFQSKTYEVKLVSEKQYQIESDYTFEDLCEGDSVILEIPYEIDGGEVIWSNGRKARKVEYFESGDCWFTFQKIGEDCVYNSNTISLIFKEVPDKPELYLENNILKVDTEANNIIWYYNNIKLSFKNVKEIKSLLTGKYKCEIYNSIGCSIFSDEFEVMVTEVEKISENELSITPNPNNGNFNLEINSKFSGLAKLTIVDLNGQDVFSKELSLTQNRFTEKINLNNAAKGVYLLKIRTEAGEVSSKFIVK